MEKVVLFWSSNARDADNGVSVVVEVLLARASRTPVSSKHSRIAQILSARKTSGGRSICAWSGVREGMLWVGNDDCKKGKVLGRRLS